MATSISISVAETLLQNQEGGKTPLFQIALLRRKCLIEFGCKEGLPSLLVSWLQDAVNAFQRELTVLKQQQQQQQQEQEGDEESTLSTYSPSDCEAFKNGFHSLKRVLNLYELCSRQDCVLRDELARFGAHILLAKLLQYDVSDHLVADHQDCVMEIQDIAGEIASQSNTFPERMAPYTAWELRKRLPIHLCIRGVAQKRKSATSSLETAPVTNSNLPETASISIQIQQVTSRQSAQEDVGFVLWPSAIVLARFLVSNPSIITSTEGLKMLELGAGCGVCGIVAACLLKQQTLPATRNQVLLTDYNPIVLDNLQHNIRLNCVVDFCSTAILDFYHQSGQSSRGWKDCDGMYHPPVDIILAADIICQRDDALAAACTLYDSLRTDGGVAYVICANAEHRFGVEFFLAACQNQNLRVQSYSVRDLFEGGLLREDVDVPQQEEDEEAEGTQGGGLTLTAGYIPDMNLTLFIIRK